MAGDQALQHRQPRDHARTPRHEFPDAFRIGRDQRRSGDVSGLAEVFRQGEIDQDIRAATLTLAEVEAARSIPSHLTHPLSPLDGPPTHCLKDFSK